MTERSWAEHNVLLVHRNGVGIPRHFFYPFSFWSISILAENILSCFIDEAGDFGEFESHSPFYIVSVIAHNQAEIISGC